MAAKTLKVQDTVFDLILFDEVTLIKEADFTPVDSLESATARLGGDSKRLLEVINKGLESDAKREMKNDRAGWHTFNEDGTVNGVYDGQPADVKKVNSLVLTLSKTVFGFSKEMPIEAKRAAKENAIKMIRETEAIRNGLAQSAALTPEED